ncbi:hypothetical protein CEUSTIGMA_g4362.t1 [Chlamydomonas eustigma]|uniref:(S)-ureidoglycine aminohydrolase cupin domain-containing protein n=1 Tax=Chlamydomonas eustigma TaxID=1157962 RepID=A0A250X1I9_9CHLO|nr:hypothetical protein CEUSTIGMA_g4362.t1 [Chlamydomonas eustigma]|eukprot:GAX76916.1 hypothetical protein CEUSTIGMA_g4362.t1 [Chlamydomonas eustigma]
MAVKRLKRFGPGLTGLKPDAVTQQEDLAPGSLMPDERSCEEASRTVQNGDLTCGTWAASAHTCKSAPYPVDEFCYILEGVVYITTYEDKEVHIFKAGEAFWIDKGTVLEWKQLGVVRKYYVIHAEQEEDMQTLPHGSTFKQSSPISKL